MRMIWSVEPNGDIYLRDSKNYAPYAIVGHRQAPKRGFVGIMIEAGMPSHVYLSRKDAARWCEREFAKLHSDVMFTEIPEFRWRANER